ncbi:SDR family oxidoreductase [Thiorhodococcus mannitoliphagus]|uniref:SDR family oxidoreductase n=1 Tax=Thiorhodococcus mannitoliphagus TaxID=329406 RepID=A0A6P1E025_9GAMM|nr:SDR family oxidoreductase [Thiorhodococcus mannitoliphagus]NEX22631.1 SDR family oxidoreductase [Thiorhodococcus mannitoliphagus]
MNAPAAPSILVTGCSTGIGHHCAHALLRRGWHVIASARKQDDVDRLAREGLTAIRLDLDSSESIAAAVEQTLELTGGRLDALFNNGAYGQPGAVEDLSRNVLRAQLETNLLGWHELTCKVIPIMRRQGQGRIVQNSSILGFMPLPFRGAYVASKYALEGLTDTLRLELRGTGIQVSLIEPGPITSAFRKNAHQAFRRNIDVEHSPHRDAYALAESRLSKEGDAQPFTLPPEAVFKKLVHALESPRPHPRYYVTFPTHFIGNIKRVLSTRAFDRLLFKISRGGAG